MLFGYFLLVILIAVPFLILGAATGIFLLPGLPIAALMAVCPGIAALIMVRRESGHAAAQAFLRDAIDVYRIRPLGLYAPILLVCPSVAVATYWWARVSGIEMPHAEWNPLTIIALALIFLVAAVTEEIGWSGYATLPLQRRFGPLSAALFIGLVWALFHIGALVQAHRPIEWIAAWAISTIATRVVLVWIFNLANQSIAAVSIAHAAQNLSWQMFPVSGSHLDYGTYGLIMTMVAIIVAAASSGKLAFAETFGRDRYQE